MSKIQSAYKRKFHKVMGEHKRGTLHSGSKHGPKVKSRKQAIAIAFSEAQSQQGVTVSNGHSPDPPKKKRSPIHRALQGQLSPGLVDTLTSIAGQRFVVDTLPDFMKDGGTIGNYPVGMDTVQVRTGMPNELARETAIHEVGHLTGEMTRRLPTARQANDQGKHEPVAQAFLRAFKALQATQRDTTNSQGVIDQFTMGIHPDLTRWEARRGYIPGTQRLFAELLALPIFAQHPLRSRQAQILFEAPSIR